MPDIKVNEDGALKFVKGRNFKNNTHIVCELLGCAPGNAENISLDIINNYLVSTIDDNGLSDDDMNRLTEYYNGGDRGHSEWGMGSRAAATQLTRDADKEHFYICDNERGIKFIYNKSDDMVKEYDILTQEEAFKLNKDYPSKIEGTKWIIPVNDETFLHDKNLEYIKNDLKLRYSKPILENNININFKGEKLSIENKVYETEDWDEIKIINVKKKKSINNTVTSSGNPQYIYKINGKLYEKDGKKKKLKTIDCEIEEIEIKYEFKASHYRPETEQLKEMSNEYNIDETKINGLVLSKKDVLKSTEFILSKGQRNAGTESSKHDIICFTDEENKLCKSTVEKNIKPTLVNAIKEFLPLYKSFKAPSKSSETNNSSTNQNVSSPLINTVHNDSNDDSQDIGNSQDIGDSNDIDNDNNYNNDISDNNDIDNDNNYNNDIDNDNNYNNDIDDSEDISDNNDELHQNNSNTQRSSKDNFSIKQRSFLYEENRKYYLETYNSCPRCPCCDRKIYIDNFHAGHIVSHYNGGKNNIKNGLAICSKCNSNDTKDIPIMVEKEWGEEHHNYIRLKNIIEALGKTYTYV